MRAPILALALVLATTAAAQEPLAGAWTATEAERNGAPAPELLGHRLSLADGEFEIAGTDGAMIYAGTYRLDPTADPSAIDFVNTEGEAAGVTWAGIWRADADTLTIVDNAPDPTRPRPTEFAAPANSGYVMLTFQRDR
jgi:uncharacterized protein (TIGR03067 family)